MTDRELAQIIWDYMRYEQPLEKVDIIIGLGGPDICVAEWAVQLWKDRWSSNLLFTGSEGVGSAGKLDMPEADWFAKRAIELGVPEDKIFIENKSTNTGENIRFSKIILESHGISTDKVIIVTRPAMLRRAYATFMKQWGENIPKIIMSSVDMDIAEYSAHTGNSFEYITNWMVGDLQRIIEYPKLGFQIEQEVPDDVKAAFEELVKRGYDKHLL